MQNTTCSYAVTLACFLLSAPLTAYAQIDSTKLEFFPLHIGDTWQYFDHLSFSYTQKIVGDTMSNGRRYFRMGNPSFPQFASPYRIDSLLRIQNLESDGHEREYNKYRLGEAVGSYWPSANWAGVFWPNPRYVMRYGSFIQDYLGRGKDAMIFYNDAIDTVTGQMSSYGFRFILVRGLGVYREEYEADRFEQLTGAFVNGINWGLISSVETQTPLQSVAFRLEQNYPNPFNPRTTIEFTLLRRSAVLLKVYNVLGQEVWTLVDGELNSGTFKVSFGSSDLPSGVYLYKIIGTEGVLSRRMILAK